MSGDVETRSTYGRAHTEWASVLHSSVALYRAEPGRWFVIWWGADGTLVRATDGAMSFHEASSIGRAWARGDV